MMDNNNETATPQSSIALQAQQKHCMQIEVLFLDETKIFAKYLKLTLLFYKNLKQTTKLSYSLFIMLILQYNPPVITQVCINLNIKQNSSTKSFSLTTQLSQADMKIISYLIPTIYK